MRLIRRVHQLEGYYKCGNNSHHLPYIMIFLKAIYFISRLSAGNPPEGKAYFLCVCAEHEEEGTKNQGQADETEQCALFFSLKKKLPWKEKENLRPRQYTTDGPKVCWKKDGQGPSKVLTCSVTSRGRCLRSKVRP